MTAPAFLVQDVRYRYPNAGTDALCDVTISIPHGACYGILGPNGSGKSTLLKVMLGELAGGSGVVKYEARAIRAWPRRVIARNVGFVPQSEVIPFPLTVRELVEMGRYPHIGALGRSGRADRAAVNEAMDRARVADFAKRPLSTLSGGERQRARIARALAQEPKTLVLDEPTASLDLRYEMETFGLVQRLAKADGLTVVIVTHNLNLAARYATHLVLLDQGRIAADGPPGEVLQRDVIERVFGWPVTITRHPGPGPDTGAPQVVPLVGDT